MPVALTGFMIIVGKRNCLYIILDRIISKSILEQVPNSICFAIEIYIAYEVVSNAAWHEDIFS